MSDDLASAVLRQAFNPLLSKPVSEPAYPMARITLGFNARQNLEIDPDFQASVETQGVHSPIWLTECGRIIAGFRRHAAAKQAGHETIPALVYPAMTEAEAIALGLLENLARKDITPYDTYAGLKPLREMGMKGIDIAARSSLSASMVSQYAKLDRLCTEAMEAFKAGKLGLTKAFQVAGSPDQLATLAMFLGGATREEVAAQTGKSSPESSDAPEDAGSGKPPAKVERVKIPLAINTQKLTVNGTVTVASLPNQKIDLEAVRKLLDEALSAVIAAQKKGISAKSFQASMIDMAAASPKPA